MRSAASGVRSERVEEEGQRLHSEGRLRDSFSTLIDAHGPEILGYLTAVLRDDERAREVWAETAARLWKGFDRFEWRSSFRAWAYAVASNAFRRHLRGLLRRREQPLTSSCTPIAAERTETRPHQKSEVKARIALLRDKLSQEDNALIILRVDRALSWNEIALTTFDCEEAVDAHSLERRSATLRKRFERIVARLRRLAEEDGLLEDPVQ
jgi:RNA polymerase sigma-70 factor (ECF subfamily)